MKFRWHTWNSIDCDDCPDWDGCKDRNTDFCIPIHPNERIFAQIESALNGIRVIEGYAHQFRWGHNTSGPKISRYAIIPKVLLASRELMKL